MTETDPKCPDCGGSGFYGSNSNPRRCPTCGGRGLVPEEPEHDSPDYLREMGFAAEARAQAMGWED